MIRRFECEGLDSLVEVAVESADDGWEVSVDGRVYRVTITRGPQGTMHLEVDGDGSHVVHTDPSGPHHLVVDGRAYRIADVAAKRTRRASHDSGGLVAPMPGTVLELRVAEGDKVTQGQVLVVVEAMKMEHAIKASKAGVVSHLALVEGQRVGAGEILVEIT